jgi:ADP-ribose pyrophosphatase YjhB (NUDIX family)
MTNHKETIRVRVAAIIRNSLQEILLVEQKKNPNKPSYYLLPGGGVELGEKLEDALKRELEEEIGFSPTKMKFLFIHDLIDPNLNKHIIQIVFETDCPENLNFSLKDPSILSVSFFPESKLQELDIRPEIQSYFNQPLDHRYFHSKWIEE